MFPHDWLISLYLRGWIYPLVLVPKRNLAKSGLDTVIDGEVDCPSRKIPKDRGTKTTVKAAQTVVPQDRFAGVYRDS